MKRSKRTFQLRRGLLLRLLLIAPGFWVAGCVSRNAARSQSIGGDFLLSGPEARVEPARTEFAGALAHFALAMGHEFRGEGPAALREYHLAIDKDPGNETLHLLASRRLMQQEQADEAIALMRRLLERDPKNQTALLWTSQLLLTRGKEAESLELLLRVVALHPSAVEPYLETVRLLLRQDREDEALQVTVQGMKHAEDPLRVMQLRAELLIRASTRDPEREVALRREAAGVLAAARERYPVHLPFTLLGASLAAAEMDIPGVFALYKALDGQEGGSLELRNTLLVHFVRTVGGGPLAESLLQRHLRQHPGDAFVHFLRGMLAEASNRNSQARGSYRMVADLNPGDVQAFRKLATLYLGTGDGEEALAILEQGLEQHPREPLLLEFLGGIHLSMDKHAEAAEIYGRLDLERRRGTALNDPLRFRILYAIALLGSGRPREAVEPLAAAAREDSGLIALLWQSQMRLGFQAEAGSPERTRREEDLLATLRALSNRLPEEPEILRFIGRTHLFRRDYTQALPALEEARRIAETRENPENHLTADLLFDLASTLERTGQIERAMALFEEVIALAPDHASALNYLAYMWAERNMNLEQALIYVERALREEPDNGAYIDTRGWIYFQMGRYPEAYRDLRRASEIEPDESVIAEHVGDVLMKLDRPVEARGYYRIALELGAAEREETVREALERAEQAVTALFTPATPDPSGADE